jgi:hypothetical protein
MAACLHACCHHIIPIIPSINGMTILTEQVSSAGPSLPCEKKEREARMKSRDEIDCEDERGVIQ